MVKKTYNLFEMCFSLRGQSRKLKNCSKLPHLTLQIIYYSLSNIIKTRRFPVLRTIPSWKTFQNFYWSSATKWRRNFEKFPNLIFPKKWAWPSHAPTDGQKFFCLFFQLLSYFSPSNGKIIFMLTWSWAHAYIY